MRREIGRCWGVWFSAMWLVIALMACGGSSDPKEEPADGDADTDQELLADGDDTDEADLDSEKPDTIVETEEESDVEAEETDVTEPDGDETESLDEDVAEESEETDTELEPDGDSEEDAIEEAEPESEPEPEPEDEAESEEEEPLYRAPVAGELRITEFLLHHKNLPAEKSQWIELYNAGSEPVSLATCRLVSSLYDGDTLWGADLLPGAYLLVGNSTDTSENGGLAMAADWGDWAFDEAGDVLLLTCPENLVIDIVYFDPAEWPFTNGRSTALDPRYLSEGADDPAYWCLGTGFYDAVNYGSPGVVNESCPFIDGDLDTDSDANPDADPDLDAESDADGYDADAELSSYAPAAGQMVITEIMPTPTGYSGNAQWFEAKILGMSLVSLEGCGLEIGGQSQPLASTTVFEPGRYLVFAAQEADNGLTPDVVWNGRAMNVIGDRIAIICGAETIDAVSYTGEWPFATHAAMALDPRAQTSLANDDKGAWCVAPYAYASVNTGSPGSSNTECADFVLDGDVDSESETDEPVDGDEDVESESESEEPVYPTGGQVVITEIMVTPVGVTAEAGQWFELTNISATDFSLGGCVFMDQYGWNATTIEASLVIPAGARLVFGRNADSALNGGVTVAYSWSAWTFDAVSGALRIRCGDPALSVDQVYFSSDTWPLAEGHALSLDPTQTSVSANGLAENWCAAGTGYGTDGNYGTPGAANPSCAPGRK